MICEAPDSPTNSELESELLAEKQHNIGTGTSPFEMKLLMSDVRKPP
jgi:hypothetical protein